MMRLLLRSLAAVTATALSLGAGPAVNWNTAIGLAPDGAHVLGNPAALIKLTEYASYTCSHCAVFAREAEAPLRLAYIRSGKVSWEMKHLIRDPVDLAVAMLADCGPKEKFFLNNAAFFARQNVWIKPMLTASAAQKARWQSPNLVARNRAIAADFHLYEIMATRGYDRMTADRCLTDAAAAKRIGAQTEEAARLGVDSTPMFALDGNVLAATYDWSLLRPQIDARL